MSSKAAPAAIQKTEERKFGLSHWMHQVLQEAEKARADFAADPVHDLRVAIRRSRSLAEGFQSVDPNPDWKKMRKAGKAVFASLGTLRDVQVLMEWIEKLGSPDDPATQKLMAHCREQEQLHKLHAGEALAAFNTRQWRHWAVSLPKSAARLRPGSEVFLEMALDRWAEARELHRIALRSRSKLALHQLRIGIKKLRYLVENFLPALHAAWSKDLKYLQDDLGEVHDLDVLWDTANRIHAFAIPEERAHWQKTIAEARKVRVDRYRAKMVGRNSLWDVWRSQLPQGPKVDQAILARLRTWASYRDTDFQHTQRVALLTMQLHDGLIRTGSLIANGDRSRTLLKAAALTHGVGRMKSKGSHHKAAARIIDRLPLPFEWTAEDLSTVALVARFHRGALPRAQKRFLALSKEAKETTRRLAGILRLADALDREHDGKVRSLRVTKPGDHVVVYADGLEAETNNAERIAAARYLLEETSGVPILVRPEPPTPIR
jgi:CHAD domain-containing protein